MTWKSLAATLGLLLLVGCAGESEPEPRDQVLSVLATAYSSSPHQTDDEPALAAWGDRLTPDRKSIAVSRDLIDLGLDHGTEVRIEGLEGTYVVLDKMARRWERRIDVYMGDDHAEAREWGLKRVTIRWVPDDV